MIEVAVGFGVGEAVGAAVGGFVPAGAVGAAVGADVVWIVGVGVVVPAVFTGVPDPPAAGEVGSAGPARGTLDGDAVGSPAIAGKRPKSPRVRLYPASASPTAREGPRRTYSVKDPRPFWPRARALDFPAGAPTLVGTSYPAYTPDK